MLSKIVNNIPNKGLHKDISNNIQRDEETENIKEDRAEEERSSPRSLNLSPSEDQIIQQSSPKQFRPPPGLEDSQPSIENLFNASFSNASSCDYQSILSPTLPISPTQTQNVTDLSDLLSRIGLQRYITAFQEQEVIFKF
jgi:hypothetical protein